VRARILIRPKEGVLDPQGQAVHRALGRLGFPVEEVRVGRLVELELGLGHRPVVLADVERVCEQLLANTLIESYDVDLN